MIVFASTIMLLLIVLGMGISVNDGGAVGTAPDPVAAMTGCFFATLGVAFFLLVAGMGL